VTSPEILRLDRQVPIGPKVRQGQACTLPVPRSSVLMAWRLWALLQERRACLLVAKVLMPVAAEMVLGRKEAYLEPLNALLGDARQRMRAYLLSVSEVRVCRLRAPTMP
jgi:hypothetical protein